MEPVQIFIGSSSNGEDRDIEAVYEYTLRKNMPNRPLGISWMRQTNQEDNFWHGFDTRNWSTPFSGFRWAIPEACGFKGRAIYTDVDMINNRNIGDLFDIDMQGKPFAARRGSRFGGHEFCVMVIDCERAQDFVMPVSRQKRIPEYHHRCIASYSGSAEFVHDLDPRWNCLDGEDLAFEDIWQLHWTKMATQPWKPAWFKGKTQEHPRQDLVKKFNELVIEAQDAGFDARNNYRNYEIVPVKYDIIGQ